MDSSNLLKKLISTALILAAEFTNCDGAMGYAFNMVVPDVRQPASLSGGSACPVRAHQLTAAANISLRWSTALGSSPVTIFTQTQDPTAQLAELEQTISTSLATWIWRLGPPSGAPR